MAGEIFGKKAGLEEFATDQAVYRVLCAETVCKPIEEQLVELHAFEEAWSRDASSRDR
jgi:hypothetical protein